MNNIPAFTPELIYLYDRYVCVERDQKPVCSDRVVKCSSTGSGDGLAAINDNHLAIHIGPGG